jgi:hypothetical protein
MMTTLTSVTTAHPFILTVSHGLLFRNPLNLRRHRCCRFSSPDFIQSAAYPKGDMTNLRFDHPRSTCVRFGAQHRMVTNRSLNS